MDRNQVQKYELDELTIKLADDASGSVLDSVYGCEIKVRVLFDYDGGSADFEDRPAIYHMTVQCDGAAQFGNDFIKLEFEDGFELTRYLTARQEDKIEEFVLARVAEQDRTQAEEDRKAAIRENQRERENFHHCYGH